MTSFAGFRGAAWRPQGGAVTVIETTLQWLDDCYLSSH